MPTIPTTAPRRKTKAPARAVNVSEVCQEIQSLQRRWSVLVKSRIMQENRLKAIIAGTMGYSSGLDESERKELFAQAGQVIKEVNEGGSHCYEDVIKSTMIGISAFKGTQEIVFKQMVQLAAALPVAGWAEEADQRGLGLGRVAVVVGECGDLSNYSSPAKVWKRMGCAPFEFNGQTRMGSSWKKGKPSLPAEKWTEFGYSPRRRSIAYVIGELILKSNRDARTGWKGPYLLRYEEAKASALANRPDWTRCPKCDGSGKTARGSACANCKGTGEVAKHCHLHGLLLATKLFLKRLWQTWHGQSTDWVDPRA